MGRRYYAFLSALEAALPVGRDIGGVQMAFSWGDAFNPRERPQSTLVAYEKARRDRERRGCGSVDGL